MFVVVAAHVVRLRLSAPARGAQCRALFVRPCLFSGPLQQQRIDKHSVVVWWEGGPC